LTTPTSTFSLVALESNFLSLAGMLVPPHEEAAPMIDVCGTAGICVIILTGTEFFSLSEEKQAQIMDTNNGTKGLFCSHTKPKHKQPLVKLLEGAPPYQASCQLPFKFPVISIMLHLSLIHVYCFLINHPHCFTPWKPTSPNPAPSTQVPQSTTPKPAPPAPVPKPPVPKPEPSTPVLKPTAPKPKLSG